MTERFTVKSSQQFETLLRSDEVQQLVTFTRQHIHRLEKSGRFPKRIHLGPNRVVWKSSDIAAWLQAKQQESAVD